LTPPWTPPEPHEWPRLRFLRRVRIFSEPDHLGYVFHDILWWGDGRRVRKWTCALDLPPVGPGYIYDP
jgi:hypothetical protein